MRISTLALLTLLVESAVGFVVSPQLGALSRTKALHVAAEIVPAVEVELPSIEVFATDGLNKSILQEQSEPFLDLELYPPGQLPENLWVGSMLVLNAWARTASPTGASTAAKILKRLEQEVDAGNDAIELSTMYYSVVAHAWAKSDHHQAGAQAEKVLDGMLARSDPSLVPNRIFFNCLMHAWSRQGNIERTEGIFERMREDPDIEIESGDYNALLAAYARQGNARAAESVLKDMLESGREPDVISYNCILDSWRQGNEPGAAERAESILETLQANYDSGESGIRPNGKSYSSVAAAYIKSGRSDSVFHAERLLSVAEDRGLVRDSYLYNSVLDAWAMSGQKDAAAKAEAILDEMEEHGSVNTVSYNTVIKAWKRSPSPNAASRAEALLNRMEQLHRDDFRLDVAPDVVTFTSVIQCYTKNGNQQGSAIKAVTLLNRMIDSCRAGNDELKPNTFTLNVVLDALAKAGDKESAEKAGELLTMFQGARESCFDKVNLNTISYTSVIDAYAKSGLSDAAQKAEGVFERMEAECAGGNTEAKPNTRSFNNLLNTWIQSGKNGSVQRAEEILKRMEQEYDDGNEDVRPDVVSYSIVMNGWSKSRDILALEKTTAVFQRLVVSYKAGNEGARPNLHTYVTLLYAVVHSKRKGAPVQAEKLLRAMYVDYTNGNTSAKPNTQAITLVMDCWAKSGEQNAGEKAEVLLDWLFELHGADKDESFKPNQMSWNAAINAWAKSRVFGKASRAKALLDRMVQLYESDNEAAMPNTFIYTAVVNAAAYTIGDATEKANAFQIATNAFKDLGKSSYGKPNQVTYTAYMTACRNLIPDLDSRASTLEVVFKKCCQDGMVNALVLQRVQSALTRDQLDSLLGDASVSEGKVTISSLPAEWKRNVQDDKGRNKKKIKRL